VYLFVVVVDDDDNITNVRLLPFDFGISF